jgi:Fe-S-cluster containining protein
MRLINEILIYKKSFVQYCKAICKGKCCKLSVRRLEGPLEIIQSLNVPYHQISEETYRTDANVGYCGNFINELCRIYPNRPDACINYPFYLFKDKTGLKYIYVEFSCEYMRFLAFNAVKHNDSLLDWFENHFNVIIGNKIGLKFIILGNEFSLSPQKISKIRQKDFRKSIEFLFANYLRFN